MGEGKKKKDDSYCPSVLSKLDSNHYKQEKHAPMVSVVIPTHNRSSTIERAIESVLNQTFKNLELIVVSDGSIDNTKEIVSKYMEKDVRVSFIDYYPPRGGNVARNTGIQAARGEYVAFLDDDDEWYREKIEQQLDLLAKDYSIGLVYTGVNIIYQDQNRNISYCSCPNISGDLSKRILLDNCIGTTSSVLVRKKILLDVGMFDEYLSALQDFELWIRVCQITKIGVVNRPLIYYYNNFGNDQISGSTQKYVEAFEYINEKHRELFQNLSKECTKKKKDNELYLVANKAMRNNEYKIARNYLKRIIRRHINIKAIVYYLMAGLDYKIILRLKCFVR